MERKGTVGVREYPNNTYGGLKMRTAKLKGTCAGAIRYDVDKNGILTELEFLGGCGGFTKGFANLAVGMHVDEIIKRSSGVQCRGGIGAEQRRRDSREGKVRREAVPLHRDYGLPGRLRQRRRPADPDGLCAQLCRP